MFDPSSITVDDVLGHIVTVRQGENDSRFLLGELCFIGLNMGLKAGELASYARCSDSYIRQLVKVYRTWPDEEQRIPFSELDYTCFKLAAYSDDPDYWLEQAADHSWSSREMKLAMAGVVIPDELRSVELVFNRVEKVIEAGGKGARYLYDRLTAYLRGVDPDSDLHSDTEAGKEEEETIQATGV